MPIWIRPRPRIQRPSVSLATLTAAAAQAVLWEGQIGRAPQRAGRSLALVAAAGLIWCPQPAPAADNTVTIDKWQQPLSRLTPAAKLAYSALNTQGYFVPPSPPAPVVEVFNYVQQPDVRVLFERVVQYQSIAAPVFAPVVVSNTITIDKWQQPLGSRAAVSRLSYAELSTAGFTWSIAPPAAVAITPAELGWLRQWPDAPPPTRLPLSNNNYITIDFAADNTQTIDKWLQPLSKAAFRRTPPRPPIAYVPLAFPTFTVSWQQPFSKAVNRPDVQRPEWFVYPQPVVVDNTVTVDKWHVRWQGPPRLRPRYAPPSFIPLPIVAPPNTETIDKWQQPLSKAAPATRLRLSNAVYVTIHIPDAVIPPEPPVVKEWHADAGVSGNWSDDGSVTVDWVQDEPDP